MTLHVLQSTGQPLTTKMPPAQMLISTEAQNPWQGIHGKSVVPLWHFENMDSVNVSGHHY